MQLIWLKQESKFKMQSFFLRKEFLSGLHGALTWPSWGMAVEWWLGADHGMASHGWPWYTEDVEVPRPRRLGGEPKGWASSDANGLFCLCRICGQSCTAASRDASRESLSILGHYQWWTHHLCVRLCNLDITNDVQHSQRNGYHFDGSSK